MHRTRRKWSFKDREWTSVLRKAWPGSRDERTTGRAGAPGNTAGRAAAADRAVRQAATPRVAAGAGAAADPPDRTASQAAPLERAASRAEVLQRAASAVGLREAASSHAAVPFPQPAPNVSKVQWWCVKFHLRQLLLSFLILWGCLGKAWLQSQHLQSACGAGHI